MNKEDFLQCMKLLGTAYNKEFDEEQVEVWYSMLHEYKIEDLTRAIKELIKTETHLPTIAHITKQIATYNVATLPNGEDEWQEVLKAVRRYGSYREEEALKSLKPYTSRIVRLIGYYRICTSTPEQQTWNRKEFIEEYNSLKYKVMENLQIGVSEKLMLNE